MLLSRLTNLSHCVSVIGRCVCACVSCVYADVGVRNLARSVRMLTHTHTYTRAREREREGGREGGGEGGVGGER